MEGALTALFQQTNALVLVAVGVFTRVSAVMFFLPGIGERSVPMRVRLAIALSIAVLLSPVIVALEPRSPETVAALALMLGAEALCGLLIGFAFRITIFALQTAGTIAAQHLSVAQMFGAGVAPEPEPTIATMLGMAGIALALMLGLHVQTVAALVQLYDVLPFGRFPSPPALGEWATARVAETFALGVTLAAPFVAIGFAYNLALGALNRAMPQLLVAMVGVPFLLWVGLVALHQSLPAMMEVWTTHLERILFDPLGGFGR